MTAVGWLAWYLLIGCVLVAYVLKMDQESEPVGWLAIAAGIVAWPWCLLSGARYAIERSRRQW